MMSLMIHEATPRWFSLVSVSLVKIIGELPKPSFMTQK